MQLFAPSVCNTIIFLCRAAVLLFSASPLCGKLLLLLIIHEHSFFWKGSRVQKA
jgi:hypothetical protein